jgi:hypothetical protein
VELWLVGLKSLGLLVQRMDHWAKHSGLIECVRVLLNLTAASFAHPTKDLGAQSHPRRLPGQETCSLHPAALSRAGSEGVVFVRFFVANPLFGAFFFFVPRSHNLIVHFEDVCRSEQMLGVAFAHLGHPGCL